MYDKLPHIEYSGNTLADISRRMYIEELIKTKSVAFEPYVVQDGELIEDVAYRKYGDVTLGWIIILTNNIIDPFNDWVLSTDELNALVDMKYDSRDGIHHYEKDGIELPHTMPGVVGITNFEYEDKVNESKRQILLLRKEYVGLVEDQVDAVLI